jgi:hypothetical protein
LWHLPAIVNLWAPIRRPVQDSPLAARDAQRFTDGDVIGVQGARI